MTGGRRVSRGVIALSLPLWLLAGCTGSSGGAAQPGVSANGASVAGTATRATVPAPTVPSATEPPTVAASTARPVPVSSAARLTEQVSVTVTRVRTVKVTSEQPGQVAGPAAAVDLLVRNDSGEAFGVDGLTVNATTGTDVALDVTTAAPSDQLTGNVPAGGSARGTYVFSLPAGAPIEGLRIEVVSDRAPVVVRFIA